MAMEWQSEALVCMALMQSHTAHCPSCEELHPLHEAISLRQPRVLEFLLGYYRSTGERGHMEELCGGMRPLFKAVDSCIGGGGAESMRMVELLLREGADPNALSDGPGEAPLHRASLMGFQGVVELLLAHGADPNLATMDGYTPLHACCRAAQLRPGCFNVVPVLLRHGADPRIRNAHGRLPVDELPDELLWLVGAQDPHAHWLTRAKSVLLRETRWRNRRIVVLARSRVAANALGDATFSGGTSALVTSGSACAGAEELGGDDEHPLMMMPDAVFRHVVTFL